MLSARYFLYIIFLCIFIGIFSVFSIGWKHDTQTILKFRALNLKKQTVNISSFNESKIVSSPKTMTFEEKLLVEITKKLNKLRTHLVKSRGLRDNGFTLISKHSDYCEESKADYFYRLYKNHPYIHTIILFVAKDRFKSVHQQQMTSVDRVPMSVSRIYPTYLDPGVCADMKRKSASLLLGTCAQLSDVRISKNPLPVRRFRLVFDRWSDAFVHVIPDGAVHGQGAVKTRTAQIHTLGCRGGRVTGKDFNGWRAWRFYPEVLTLSQYWASGFWHFSIESFPRIYPYIRFLRENRGVRIHVLNSGRGFVGNALRMVGIDPGRVVMGHVRARIVYLPAGGKCGAEANRYNIQGIAGVYQNFITNSLHGNWHTRGIILIQRTVKRRLLQHGQIAAILRDEAKRRNLDFIIFSDAHYPPIDYALRSFQRAALIVAPHGAGLSNMIYTRPPASVIEVMCYQKHQVFCYPPLSQTLGHRHFAIKAISGCEVGMTVDLTRLQKLVTFILDNYS